MAVQNKLKKLEKYYREKKLAHAYLLETNDKEQCLKDVMNFLKVINCPNEYKDGCSKCNICRLLDSFEFPNVVIVRPDGKTIKKEQILEVKRKLSYKPIFSDVSAYIIVEAEKLNGSSANTMLKFIEEPEDNCYGFFITNNKENVLLTIQSRCENEKIVYDCGDIFKKLDLDEDKKGEFLSIIYEYLLFIEKEKCNIMGNRNILLNKFTERSDIEKIFKIMFDVFNEVYLNSVGVIEEKKYDNFVFLYKNSLKVLEKKMFLIADLLNKINYNMNMELMLDKFVIEMGEIHG